MCSSTTIWRGAERNGRERLVIRVRNLEVDRSHHVGSRGSGMRGHGTARASASSKPRARCARGRLVGGYIYIYIYICILGRDICIIITATTIMVTDGARARLHARPRAHARELARTEAGESEEQRAWPGLAWPGLA